MKGISITGDLLANTFINDDQVHPTVIGLNNGDFVIS